MIMLIITRGRELYHLYNYFESNMYSEWQGRVILQTYSVDLDKFDPIIRSRCLDTSIRITTF